MSDNFHFDISGASLAKSLEIAFTHHKTAVGWVEVRLTPKLSDGTFSKKNDNSSLVLYWADKSGVNKFPVPLTFEEVRPMIESWLKKADYGRYPIHDGDNSKSHRVFNETWGHVNGDWEAFVAIEPCWMMNGK